MIGGSMMSQGLNNGEGVGENGFNWGKLLQQGLNVTGGLSQMAYGGEIPQLPVEVEGEEVGETPDGNVMKFKGPSHEQGGIDVNLPEGTEMFSKRIKVDNVSMADRKSRREKRTLTLEKLLEKNKNDILSRNTLMRTKQVNEKEEEFDKSIQELIKGLLPQEVKEKNHLVDINEKQKFQGGGTVGFERGSKPLNPFIKYLLEENANNSGTIPSLATPGIVPTKKFSGKKLYSKLKINDYFSDSLNNVLSHLDLDLNLDDPKSVKNYQKAIGMKKPDGKFGIDTFKATKEQVIPIVSNTYKPSLINENYKTELPKIDSATKFYMPGPNLSNKKPVDFNLGTITPGDIISMMGNYVSTFEPMKNTLENRAGDTPNINAFENFGKDGLEAIESQKQYLDDIRDEQLQSLELARAGQLKNNRNSARGLNTMRALDLISDSKINDAQGNVYQQYANQLMQMMAQKAHMENQQDQIVMQGDYQRDLADRQDRDNFYSQMAQDISTKGQGLQEIGYDINKMKEREVRTKLLGQLSRFGFGIDEKGNLIKR